MRAPCTPVRTPPAAAARWRRRDMLAALGGVAGRYGLGTFAAGCALVAGPARAASSTVLHARHTGDIGALVLVDAVLEERSVRLLLDTGASTMLVSPALVRELALPLVERVPVATLGGPQRADRVRLPALRLAGATLPAGTALALDLPAMLGPALAGVDGVLGLPALAGLPLGLDLAAQRLVLGDEALTLAAQADWQPLRLDGTLPVVELRLGARAPAPFLLDTGNAGALVVFEAHAQRLLADGPRLPPLTVQELGGRVSAQLALIERVDGAGWSARDVPAALESGARARRGGAFDRLAGSLGGALLRGAQCVIDLPRQRWRLAPAERPVLPGGFGVVLVDGPLRAAAVIDGSPAAAAGVRPGDRLVALQGVALHGTSAHDIWRALDGVERAAMGWQRDGEPPRDLTLQRERFLPRLA